MTSKKKKKKRRNDKEKHLQTFQFGKRFRKKDTTTPIHKDIHGKDTTFRTGFNKEIFLFDTADKEEDVRPQTSRTISDLVNICKCFRERNYTLRHLFFNYRLQMRFVRAGKCIP